MKKNAFGYAMTQSFKSQVAMFPAMLNEEVVQVLANMKNQCKGYKSCGAGGGGYLLLFDANGVEDTMKVRIRR